MITGLSDERMLTSVEKVGAASVLETDEEDVDDERRGGRLYKMPRRY